MTNREKTLLGFVLLVLIALDICNILELNKLNNTSKYELKQMAVVESKQSTNEDYSSLKRYIQAKKQKDYYTSLVSELKPLAIDEMKTKGDKSMFMDGVYVDLYVRKYTNKKDSTVTSKQIIKISY